MSKFNKDNKSNYTVVESKVSQPCLVCGCETNYIDFTCEAWLCSEECHDKMIKQMTKSMNRSYTRKNLRVIK